jgi:hypothetical protein
MGERDIGGEARERLGSTVAIMLAVLGSGAPGDPVSQEAFVLGFHRAMCALFLTESRALELGAIVVSSLLMSRSRC